MKSVTNRALWAKKKMYKQPIVEQTEMMPQSVILSGSSVVNNTSIPGGSTIEDPNNPTVD